MQFNVKALAITSGILWGVTLFWEVLVGGALEISTLWTSPEVAKMVASIYPGVTLTVGGAFLALIWGLACGAFCGGIFGWLYNYLPRKFS